MLTAKFTRKKIQNRNKNQNQDQQRKIKYKPKICKVKWQYHNQAMCSKWVE